MSSGDVETLQPGRWRGVNRGLASDSKHTPTDEARAEEARAEEARAEEARAEELLQSSNENVRSAHRLFSLSL